MPRGQGWPRTVAKGPFGDARVGLAAELGMSVAQRLPTRDMWCWTPCDGHISPAVPSAEDAITSSSRQAQHAHPTSFSLTYRCMSLTATSLLGGAHRPPRRLSKCGLGIALSGRGRSGTRHLHVCASARSISGGPRNPDDRSGGLAPGAMARCVAGWVCKPERGLRRRRRDACSSGIQLGRAFSWTAQLCLPCCPIFRERLPDADTGPRRPTSQPLASGAPSRRVKQNSARPRPRREVRYYLGVEPDIQPASHSTAHTCG